MPMYIFKDGRWLVGPGSSLEVFITRMDPPGTILYVAVAVKSAVAFVFVLSIASPFTSYTTYFSSRHK